MRSLILVSLVCVFTFAGCSGFSQCDQLANVSSQVARYICEQLSGTDTTNSAAMKSRLVSVENYVRNMTEASALAVDYFRSQGDETRAQVLEKDATYLNIVLADLQTRRRSLK